MAIVCHLIHTTRKNDKDKNFVVVSTKMCNDITLDMVNYLQTFTLLKEIEGFMKSQDIRNTFDRTHIIIGGDFNSAPDMSSYHLMCYETNYAPDKDNIMISDSHGPGKMYLTDFKRDHPSYNTKAGLNLFKEIHDRFAHEIKDLCLTMMLDSSFKNY